MSVLHQAMNIGQGLSLEIPLSASMLTVVYLLARIARRPPSTNQRVCYSNTWPKNQAIFLCRA